VRVEPGLRDALLRARQPRLHHHVLELVPVEAAEIGNLAMQALAIGELASIAEVRELVDRSFTTQTYEPRARAPWDDAYARLERSAAATDHG